MSKKEYEDMCLTTNRDMQKNKRTERGRGEGDLLLVLCNWMGSCKQNCRAPSGINRESRKVIKRTFVITICLAVRFQCFGKTQHRIPDQFWR